MSTTRWRYGKGGLLDNLWAADVSRLMEENAEAVFRTDLVEAFAAEGLILVDPDNLPPEAIQRAAKVAREVFSPFNDPGGSVSRTVAQEIIRAFLSDPEDGTEG